MVTPQDSQYFDSYVPVYDVAPTDWSEGRAFLVEQLKALSNAINVREIGFYLDQEVLSGKQFIPGTNIVEEGGTSQQFRTILRKVVDFGQLPNAGLKSVPHGIYVDANFSLIQIFASASDPTNLMYLPIPFVGNLANTSIQLDMDATNVNITTQSNRSSFTRTFVVIEYIQEL